jgi:hypothetical protein
MDPPLARPRSSLARSGREVDTMHALHSRAVALRWLAAGAVAVGLLAGSAWYATPHLTDGQLASLTGRASAQEVAPPAPTGPAANSRRPTGEVTQVTSDPDTFTLRTADGVEATYRVLDTTVFMAGHDRPYRFELLKQGDRVTVRGGGAGNAADGVAPTAPTGAGKGTGKQAREAGPNGMADGEPVARQVTVRPAGEKGKKHGKQGPAASLPAGSTDGGSDATRQ